MINPFDLIANARAAGSSGPRAVQVTSELQRIVGTLIDDPDESKAGPLATALTAQIRKEGSTAALNVRQAIAIATARHYKGGIFMLPVGSGKGWIDILLPGFLYDLGVRRPGVLVPSRMRDSTRRVYRTLRQEFTLHPRMNEEAIVGHGELSTKKGETLLQERRFDLIIIDEAQAFKNKKSKRTRLLLRYIRRHNPIVVMQSGTLFGKSLMELHHLFQSVMPNAMPMPGTWSEAAEWARALDVDTPPEARLAPGGLEKFSKLFPEAETVADAYGRRLATWPGVVSTPTRDVSCALTFETHNVPLTQETKDIIQHVRDTWETPNGEAIAEAVGMWRCVRQLALGYWLRWKDPAPRPWLDARREWAAYVRQFLKFTRKEIDSESQVALLGGPEWEAWKSVKDTYVPETVIEWRSTEALDWAAGWMKKGGIVWVDSPYFGKRLNKLTEAPYFGAGDDAEEHGDAPAIICSTAQATGKNLQRYSRNLVTSPPSDGLIWEQLVGRTHRQGQIAEEVSVDILTPAEEAHAAIEKARRRAARIQEVQQTPQKLCYGDWL